MFKFIYFVSYLLVLSAIEYDLSSSNPFFKISPESNNNQSDYASLAILMNDIQTFEKNSIIIFNILDDLHVEETIQIFTNLIWKGKKNAILFGTYGEIQVANLGQFSLENLLIKKKENSSFSMMSWFLINDASDFFIKVLKIL